MFDEAMKAAAPWGAHPFAARHTTMVRISTDKKRNQLYLDDLNNQYTELEAGIAALNELAIPVAHPGQMKQQGAWEDVTYDALAALMNSHFVGSHELDAVTKVLECLRQLSEELDEDLCIDTHTPPTNK